MLLIRRSHPTQINTKRHQAATRSYQIGCCQIGMRSDEAGCQHSDSHSEIKRCQISGSCRSTHMMRSDIYEKTLDSRDTNTESDAYRQRRSKKNNFIMKQSKYSKRKCQKHQRTNRYQMYLPVIDQPPGDKPCRTDPYRHKNKEITGIRHIDLFSVQHDERNNHPIRDCTQQVSQCRR